MMAPLCGRLSNPPEAIEATLTLARQAACEIRARPMLHLLHEPELTALVFRREGWDQADYDAWAEGLLESGTAFVLPTSDDGEPAARLAILNPRTTLEDVTMVLDAMG